VSRVQDEALALEGASVSLGGRRVLEDLDLRVRRGERLALLGPSGAGKTTLLRLLSGALAPDAGQVRILGKALARLGGRERRAVRRRVGLLYQNDALYPQLRVVHNVLMGRLGSWSLAKSLVSLFFPQEVPRARAALATVQLEDKLYATIASLSGGQRQRVLVARLLLQDPDVILADEPAAFLDPRLGRSVVELLLGLAAERGGTLVVSLHDVSLVLPRFDRVIALRAGRVFWEGAPSGLDARRVAAIFEGERPGDGA
jgi:phosphonate transport system ATP-binding protein